MMLPIMSMCEFGQVEEHPCFGKGAVRATRVRHAVTSSTCSDWCLVMFTAVVVAGVVAAAKLAVEQIANMQEVLEQVVATAGLAAVPISLLLWIFKVFLGVVRFYLREGSWTELPRRATRVSRVTFIGDFCIFVVSHGPAFCPTLCCIANCIRSKLYATAGSSCGVQRAGGAHRSRGAVNGSRERGDRPPGFHGRCPGRTRGVCSRRLSLGVGVTHTLIKGTGGT